MIHENSLVILIQLYLRQMAKENLLLNPKESKYSVREINVYIMNFMFCQPNSNNTHFFEICV